MRFIEKRHETPWPPNRVPNKNLIRPQLILPKSFQNTFAELMADGELEDRQNTDDSSAAPIAKEEIPVSPRAIIEAMLFVGHPDNKPLSSKMLASLLRGVSPEEVDEQIQLLNEDYEGDNRAIVIEGAPDGYRMRIRPELKNVCERFYGKTREARLSQSAIDVLALVAYHQPVERKKIEELRGVPSSGILNQLVRRRLISVKQTQKPRSKVYSTTERFLNFFNLESIDDLPKDEEL